MKTLYWLQRFDRRYIKLLLFINNQTREHDKIKLLLVILCTLIRVKNKTRVYKKQKKIIQGSRDKFLLHFYNN